MLDHRPHMALLHYYHSYAVPSTSEEDALAFFCFQLLSPHSANGSSTSRDAVKHNPIVPSVLGRAPAAVEAT